MDRKTRFLSKVFINPENDCWEWQATIYPSGYGQFYWGHIEGKDKTIKAHRAAWLILKGEVPWHLQVLHKCHNRKCCNPDHLYLGTHADNMRDRNESGRTSKWNKRYNFKRHDGVIQKVIELRKQRVKIKDICSFLNLARTTVYRCLGIAA